MSQLDGKTALITGAKGGLGTHVTEAFLAAGATVTGVSRSISDSDFHHPRFHAMPAELSSTDGARALVDAVAAKHERIDIAVHLVGAWEGGRPAAETDDEVLDRMLSVNLGSAFYLMRAVIPHMRRAAKGRILAIGSRAAIEPIAKSAAYNASKAALVALIRTLAKENTDAGITANIVLPGTMDTPANRKAMPRANFSHWVRPAQIASLLVHLASDEAADINGAVIPVYGAEL